jgi:hypothetical protein
MESGLGSTLCSLSRPWVRMEVLSMTMTIATLYPGPNRRSCGDRLHLAPSFIPFARLPDKLRGDWVSFFYICIVDYCDLYSLLCVYYCEF